MKLFDFEVDFDHSINEDSFEYKEQNVLNFKTWGDTKHLLLEDTLDKNELFLGDLGDSINQCAALIFNGLILKDTNLFFNINSNTLNSISGLRALRFLAEKVWDKFNIYGVSDYSEYSVFDARLNILRSMNHNFCALVGGADQFHTFRYDLFLKNKNESSKRISSTCHEMLIEESHLKKVRDPMKGSFLVEKKSLEIASKSWSLLQKLLKEYDCSFKETNLYSELKKKYIESSKKRILDREVKITGVNDYINPSEFFSENDLIEHDSTLNLIERIRIENSKKNLKVAALCFGDPKIYFSKLSNIQNLSQSYGLECVAFYNKDLKDCDYYYLCGDDYGPKEDLVKLDIDFKNFSHQDFLENLKQSERF